METDHLLKLAKDNIEKLKEKGRKVHKYIHKCILIKHCTPVYSTIQSLSILPLINMYIHRLLTCLSEYKMV